MSRKSCDRQSPTLGTLDYMAVGSKESVGKRIRECAESHKPPLTPSSVLAALLPKIQKRDPKANLTRQTVSYWFNGKHLPPNDLVPDLADILGSTPEYLMFGKRRGDQLKQERTFLGRLNQEEAELLSLFREASESGQRVILKTIETLAREHPAPEAAVHPFRRKTDLKP